MPDILISGDHQDKIAGLSASISKSTGIVCQTCTNEEVIKQAMLGRHDFIVIHDDDDARAKRSITFLRGDHKPVKKSIVLLSENIKISDLCCNIEQNGANYKFLWNDDIDSLCLEVMNCFCQHRQNNKYIHASTKALRDCRDDWKFEILINHDRIEADDYISNITTILAQYSNLSPHIPVIHTIISELYNNAVEHGLLELSSRMKQSPAGFEEYYELKQKASQNLDHGHVYINLSHYNNMGKNELHIQIQDSGNGFDYQNIINQDSHTGINPYGRGIHLVRTLCSSIKYSGNGNTVDVVYTI